MNDYTWDNGLNLSTVLKYDHSTGSLVYQTPMELKNVRMVRLIMNMRQPMAVCSHTLANMFRVACRV